MGSRLLCCVALCLLGAGPLHSVLQTPQHLIKAKGQQVSLRCSPLSGHLSVYWYKQTLGQGLQFLFQYYDKEQRDKGDIPARYSAQQFPGLSSEVNLSSLEPGDSALFLCASSLAQPHTNVSLLYKIILVCVRKWQEGGTSARLVQAWEAANLSRHLVLSTLVVCSCASAVVQGSPSTCPSPEGSSSLVSCSHRLQPAPQAWWSPTPGSADLPPPLASLSQVPTSRMGRSCNVHHNLLRDLSKQHVTSGRHIPVRPSL
uniref:Ig-like domain-containing protein n=1 Tax=Sciurus vulgaris TaxID=55149 RepID=A0A8D2D0D8_SCIVU